MKHLHIRIHRWVIWWLCIGVVVGTIAVLNILLRELTRTQDKVILIIGIVHWVLGGIVCWAYEGITIAPARPPEHSQPARTEAAKEWHSASDFILPGGRKSILPPRY